MEKLVPEKTTGTGLVSSVLSAVHLWIDFARATGSYFRGYKYFSIRNRFWLVIHCNVNHDLKRPEHRGVRAAALKHAFEISERYCMNEVCSMIRGNGRSALERERAHLLQLVLVGNMVEPSFAARGTIDVHDRG